MLKIHCDIILSREKEQIGAHEIDIETRWTYN